MPFKKIDISVTIREYPSDRELPQDDRLLVQKARQAAGAAYAPYSKFKVGAAVRLENGGMVAGNNQENAAYPSGICAERTAIFYASANNPDETIEAIAVSCLSGGDEPSSPCGACRQVLLEYELKQESPIRVILTGKTGKVLVVGSAKDLLPLAFGKNDLK